MNWTSVPYETRHD